MEAMRTLVRFGLYLLLKVDLLFLTINFSTLDQVSNYHQGVHSDIQKS